MKIMCSMCKQVKDESEFRFIASMNRHYSYCSDCNRAYNRFYKRAWRERKREQCLTEQNGV